MSSHIGHVSRLERLGLSQPMPDPLDWPEHLPSQLRHDVSCEEAFGDEADDLTLEEFLTLAGPIDRALWDHYCELARTSEAFRSALEAVTAASRTPDQRRARRAWGRPTPRR